MKYINLAIGLTIGNFICPLFGISTIEAATERSFFQAVAVFLCFILTSGKR